MIFEELKDRALSLPMEPGVYIMRDKTDTVIYVGKAKKLKNRVSQYFQDTASHTPKTRMMVSRIHLIQLPNSCIAVPVNFSRRPLMTVCFASQR